MFCIFTRQSMLFKLPQDVYKTLGSDCKYFEVPAHPIKIMYTTISVERSLVQLLLCIVDTFDYRLLLFISLRYFVHSGSFFVTLFGRIIWHCVVLVLVLRYKVLVLVLTKKAWSWSWSWSRKISGVLVLVLKKKSYLHLCRWPYFT